MSTLNSLIRPRRTAVVLAAAIAVGLCLRLWGIRDLFNAVHDYDPGVHALAGRFIAEGNVLYRDFVSVHPPLYDLTLGAIFRVFGYDYYFVPYLSVVFSLASLVLVYFVARRLYSSRAGLIAAGLFAVEPMMVYFGRRGVQEAMGLFLVLVAAVLALRYLDEKRSRTLLRCGFVLGLAVATKYVFVPVAAGIGCALLLLSLPPDLWSSVRRLGSLRFWGAYALVAGVAYAVVVFLRIAVGMPVPLPFIDPLFAAPRHVAVCLMVFGVPLLVLWRRWAPERADGAWPRALWRTITSGGLWVWAVGVVLGFLVVTGYFWVTAPGDFLTQTVLWQTGRMTTEVPSLLGIARLAFQSPVFFRMALLSIVSIVPLCLALLNRRDFGRSDCFLAVVMVVSLLLSQGLYQLPRYYASALVFALVALAGLAATESLPDRRTWSTLGSLAVLAVLATSMAVSLGLLRNYGGYDVASPGGPTGRTVYDSTNECLVTLGARKVFSTNPIYPALCTDYESSLDFDTYAVLFLAKVPPKEAVANLRASGVDYVVIDAWTWFWEEDFVREMVEDVRGQGSLVALIQPDTAQRVEVYSLDGAGPGLANGTFDYWTSYEGVSYPLGWIPVLQAGPGDGASIGRGGLDADRWVQLTVSEDGESETGSSTHAGIVQTITFPRVPVIARVQPGVNTESLGATPLGPAIHFLDGEGHSVILGFSDEIEEEQAAVCSECGHVAVIRPAPLYRWSEHSIDVAKYWQEAGWEIPEELTVLVVLSAHADYPGYYTFHVGSVTCDSPA